MKRLLIPCFLMFATNALPSSLYKIITLPEDKWELYRDLRLQAVLDCPEAFGTTYEEELHTYGKDWKRRLGLNMLFAQDFNGNIVGMIGAVIEHAIKTSHIALIVSFYVVPEMRDAGVGSALLKTLLEKLEFNGSIKKIILKVTSCQTKAIQLYKKFGFHISGVLESEYVIQGKEYDQYIMTKSLNGDIRNWNHSFLQKVIYSEIYHEDLSILYYKN